MNQFDSSQIPQPQEVCKYRRLLESAVTRLLNRTRRPWRRGVFLAFIRTHSQLSTINIHRLAIN